MSPDATQIAVTTTHAPRSALAATTEEDPGHVRVAIELDGGCGEESIANSLVERVPLPLAAALADRLLVVSWSR